LKKENLWVAVVGAGAVGGEMVKILRQRKFPLSNLAIFARSKREEMIGDRKYDIQELKEDSLDQFDLALIAGSDKYDYHPGMIALERRKKNPSLPEITVIDNGNEFRMHPDVPLVVPEVNPQALENHKGFIASPNCSTIQLVMVLKPLMGSSHIDLKRVKRVVITTFQAVSGHSAAAREELKSQQKDLADGMPPMLTPGIFPRQIASNCIPMIGSFREEDGGYTTEEMKLVNETRKILGDHSLQITATAVRVPVDNAHGMAVNVEFAEPVNTTWVNATLHNASGVLVPSNIHEKLYSGIPSKKDWDLFPTQLETSGKDDVYVGRLRQDLSVPHGLDMWIVADNLRKGAALNVIQIAEHLINNY